MLYKELGDKQGLGDALVVREAERFLVGIQEVLDAHVGQAAEAIIQSIRFSLDEAEASPLRKAVLTASRTDSEREIDVIELNEAFAAQVLACLREWKVDPTDERLNPNGSGISLGHPVGATGGRILATMAHEMQRRGSRYGLETMCIGGGQGLAAIFEAVR